MCYSEVLSYFVTEKVKQAAKIFFTVNLNGHPIQRKCNVTLAPSLLRYFCYSHSLFTMLSYWAWDVKSYTLAYDGYFYKE